MHPFTSQRSGFSLLEMVMVLALIALLASLAVINLSNVYDTADTIPTEDLLAMAVREARYQALLEKAPVTLGYNASSGAFEVRSGTGRLLADIRTDHDPGENPIEVHFLIPAPLRGTPADLRPFESIEFMEVPRVTFGPHLTSNPFRVELKERARTLTFQFDPFSNVRFRTDETQT